MEFGSSPVNLVRPLDDAISLKRWIKLISRWIKLVSLIQRLRFRTSSVLSPHYRITCQMSSLIVGSTLTFSHFTPKTHLQQMGYMCHVTGSNSISSSKVSNARPNVACLLGALYLIISWGANSFLLRPKKVYGSAQISFRSNTLLY